MKYLKYVWILNLLVGISSTFVALFLLYKHFDIFYIIINIISAIGNFYFVYQKWKK